MTMSELLLLVGLFDASVAKVREALTTLPGASSCAFGVYLRLSGLPVPAIYGPSADDSWGF